MKNRMTIFFLAILSLIVCSIVFADGDSRKPTPAEKDFSKSVLNAIAKAMPPGPEGWEKTGESTVISDLTVVYSAANDPIKIEYCIAWQDTKRIHAAQIQQNEDLMKIAKKPGFTAKELEESQKKFEPQDVKVRIDVIANLSSQSIYEKVSPAPAMGGGLVYKSQGEFRSSSGWREGATYIFLGKSWKMITGGGTYVNFTPDKKAASSTIIQSIMVKIQAESGRTERMAQSINWEDLNSLIKK
jgi:hypothetical protein